MKSEKGRNRTGSLYRRWKGQKYPVDDSSASGRGAIYLKYIVNGKVFEQSLRTSNVTEAKKKQAEIMRPLELANKQEVLEQTELRLKRVRDEQTREWEKNNPPLKLDDVWGAYDRSQNRPRSGQRTHAGYASQYKNFKEWIEKAFPDIIFMRDVGVVVLRFALVF